MIKVDKDKCQGCGACVNVCPVQAISLIGGIANIDNNKCVECLRCVNVCPVGAISSDKIIQSKKISQSKFPSSSIPFRFFRRGGGMGRGRGRGGGRWK